MNSVVITTTKGGGCETSENIDYRIGCSGDHWIYTKLFDASGTFLNHKEQPVGILLYVTVGWYSKPEIIQFLIQYIYTGVLLWYFISFTKNK